MAAVWFAAALALGGLQPLLDDETHDDPAAFLPRDAESTRALELVRERFDGRETAALLVYQRSGGLRAEDLAAIDEDFAALAGPGVAGVISPLSDDGERIGLRSRDGTTAVGVVALRADDVEGMRAPVARLRALAAAGAPPGLATHVTGPAGISVDAVAVLGGVDATLLIASVSLIVLLLLCIYRAPAIALVPIAVVVLAYAVAAGLVYLLARAGLEITSQATAVLVVLMFGAGTDYCLLVIARFREECATAPAGEALARATRATRGAITSSALTVAAAMLVLGAASLSSTRTMGPVLALGAGIAALACLTLLPAVLALLGERAFWPTGARPPGARGAGIWQRIAGTVSRRPRAVLGISVAALAVAALGSLVSLPALGFGGGFRDSPDAVQGQRALAAALPPGDLSPTDVLVQVDDPADRQGAARAVAASVARAPGVARIRDAPVSTDERIAHLLVSLDSDPYGHAAGERIPAIRAAAREAAAGRGATALVGGSSAQNLDTRETVRSDAWHIVPLTLLLIFCLLAALLRAVVAPLVLIASVVLSFAATLGITTLLLAGPLDAPGIDPSLPTFAFLFVVALGVDYNIFLVTRTREAIAAGRTPRAAAVEALAGTGGVITSAGLILAGTFLTLVLLPFWSLVEIGLAVSVGVLVDALIVRTLVVPAALVLLGERAWWPGQAV